MNDRSTRQYWMLFVVAILIAAWGCSYDGTATLSVKNTGPVPLIVVFSDVTTRLEPGATEVYTITLPGGQSREQILIWHPVIHPSRKFYEYVSIVKDEERYLELFYDPKNPPPTD